MATRPRGFALVLVPVYFIKHSVSCYIYYIIIMYTWDCVWHHPLATPPHADNIMCGVHFTDKQYEYDPVSGDVTVEWEGTGPSKSNTVSEFLCKTDDEALQSCEHMHDNGLLLIGVCMHMQQQHNYSCT